jgi:hypothetical protein
MQVLTAAIRGDWHDWWRLRAPLLRRSGVWPTKASTSIARVREWWSSPSAGAPRYSRLVELGSSQQSSVWAAVARNVDDVCQMVVLKGVGNARANDPEATVRLMDEARLTARMSHPNVVAMHGLLREGKRPVMVLEYLAGQSLGTLLASANDLPAFSLELRLAIVTRLLRGLDYVHRLRDFDGRPLRVLHGGIAPENVVVTYDGEVKLIDFARASVRTSALDEPLARRRLPYAPPEQFSGAPDLRGDIFSVGVILWELVANRPLWGRIPTPTLVRRLLAGDIPRLRDVVPGIDGELDRICARALAPHPDGRFRSAADLRGELEHYLAVRQAFVADAAIGALVGNACRELRRAAQNTMDSRLGELALSLPPSKLPAPSAALAPAPARGGVERRHRTVAASIVAAAVLIAAFLWGVALRREPFAATEPNPGDPLGSDRATAAEGAAAGDAQRLVRIELRARPAHAVLFVDGRRLSSNPLHATMVWDPHEHTLRAEADGYEPFTTRFRLGSDVTIDAALRPKPSGAVRRSERSSDQRVVLRHTERPSRRRQ